MESLLKHFPQAVRDNIGLVTLLVGAGVLVALAEVAKAPKKTEEERKFSAEKRQRTMDELPKFNTSSHSQRLNNRRVSVAGESVNPDSFKQTERVLHPKSGEARERIARTTEKTLLFRNLDHRLMAEIVDAMFEVKVPTGHDIIKQGDEGDNFYVVDSGHFEIFVNNKKVAEARDGGSFGELALLYGEPRAATVRATVDSILWAVDRTSFRRIVMGSNMMKRQKHESFLKSVNILSNLSPEELVKAADALQPVLFSKGDLILEEGEIGETFYIVEEGEVVVHKLDANGNKQELARKSVGDYFGEIALLNDGYRVASVSALTDVSCLVLDKAAFVRLLGPCIEILKRNMSTYQQFRPLLNE